MAPIAVEPYEAGRQDSAAKVVAQLLLHVGRQRPLVAHAHFLQGSLEVLGHELLAVTARGEAVSPELPAKSSPSPVKFTPKPCARSARRAHGIGARSTARLPQAKPGSAGLLLAEDGSLVALARGTTVALLHEARITRGRHEYRRSQCEMVRIDS